MEYEAIQKLENLATEKLIDYINRDGRTNTIFYDNLEKYVFLEMDGGRLPFNLWLCCDFRDFTGKGFAHRLIETDKGLSSQEVRILKEKLESYVTIIEVKGFEEPYVKVFDVMNHLDLSLLEPQSSLLLKEGDYLLARVGKVLGESRMMGEVSFIPKTVIPYLRRAIIREYNKLGYPHNSMKGFLKNNTLFVYETYYDTVYENYSPEDEDLLPVYHEMDEFEEFLLLKNSSNESDKHLSNLIEIYEYCLSDDGMSLKDLDKISLKRIFHDGISEKFITSPLMLNSYISTLKEYLGFLARKNQSYRQAAAELMTISQERFKLVKEILKQNRLSQGDPLLSIRLREIDHRPTTSYLNDFDRFLLYIFEHSLELTETRRSIKKKDMNHISRFFEGDYPMYFSRKGTSGMAILHFFQQMGLALKLLRIKDGFLTVAARSEEYLSLSREDKLTMHLKCFWQSGFIKSSLGITLNNARNLKQAYIKATGPGSMLATSMEVFEEITGIDSETSAHFIRLLDFMGIVHQTGWNEDFVQSPIGRLARAHFLEWDRPRGDKVIQIKQYRQN